MAATFTSAPTSITRMLDEAVRRYHPGIAMAGVTVNVVCATAKIDEKTGEPSGPALKLHGVPCAGTCKVNSHKDRVEGKSDATITLDFDRWQDLGDDERMALLDHELEHLVLCDGTDDAGRPKIKTRPDDWTLTGFFSVCERHKKAALEAQAFLNLHKELTQQIFHWG